ncbi:hypothetical protein RXV86_18150 [Alisedimentitalea sp. MJ-SS2]|uniref:hypothetical protein n=1 Tax=Aliisedimentitalea sp. MJ-SS2 TaxID=3049795 RepID=UPI00290DE3C7|nr:hypothetical protein [Alisedimentitalea sp. MJ-SS2]MDU8929319.1 hypothetical protein [Alisedimentitalea sp. MJ-SS2]
MDRDHVGLKDTFASRRYFKKFEAITGHLTRVAAQMQAEGEMSERETEVLTRYVIAIGYTFKALSMKYLLAGRDAGRRLGTLEMDVVESGFPVFTELLVMANDAAQAAKHLERMPSESALKDQMVRKILGDRELPTKLQYALSQRLYYQELMKGELFWARNDPDIIWLAGEKPRTRFLIHWAVYDSQINLPTVYMMEVEDTGRNALPLDERRWPEVQAHLMAQSAGDLKLVTIARGFDEDFDDLHPKRLKRYHLGPMYSSAFTSQSGPLREVLRDARAPEGQDWALAWTLEELESERVTEVRSGWFSTVERQVFALDPFSGRGVETGATRTERAIILPQRPYQVLEERQPAGFSNVRKFVVSPEGRVLSYR